VESVHQQHAPEGRQQQGAKRHRPLLLTARISLRSGGGGGSNGGVQVPAARQLLQQQAAPGTAWQAVKLMSLTPHSRQLQALVAAQRLPSALLSELLSPTAAGPAARAALSAAAGEVQSEGLAAVQPPLPPPLLAALRRRYNSSQQAAIATAAAGYLPAGTPIPGSTSSGGSALTAPPRPGGHAASGDGKQIILVQGPPGTGKTSAILGMLSVFLATNTPKGKSSSGGKPAAEDWSKTQHAGEGEEAAAAATGGGRRRAAVVNPAVRVLVCAQSNAAVDELCARLASCGILGR
jgi:senataxin